MQTDRRSLLKGLAAAGLAVSGMGLAQAATVLAGKPAASADVLAVTSALRSSALDAAFVARLKALIERAGLPTKGPVIDATDNAGRYLELMRIDKKSEAGEIRFVLIDGPGKAVVRPAPDALVREVIDACCA